MPSSPSRCHSAGVMCAAASGRMCCLLGGQMLGDPREQVLPRRGQRSPARPRRLPARQAATAVVTLACASAMPSCWLSIRSTVATTSAGTRGCSTGQSSRSSPTWWWCSRAPSRSRWSATTVARTVSPGATRARGPAPGRTGGGSSRAPPPCRGCRWRWWDGHAGFLSSEGRSSARISAVTQVTSRSRDQPRRVQGGVRGAGGDEQPHGVGRGVDAPAAGERAPVGDGLDQSAEILPPVLLGGGPQLGGRRRRRRRRPRRRPAARRPAPRRAPWRGRTPR